MLNDTIKPQEQYDVVIVGTSPIMLLEAFFQAKSGKSVAIFDDRVFPGGAWYTRDIWGLKNVEMGCHIFEKYTGGATRFLKKHVGIPLVQVKPQPVGIYKSFWVPQQLSSLRYDFLQVFYSLVSLNIKKWIPAFRRFLRTFLGVITFSNYFYPQNGCGEMVNRLRTLNKEAGTHLFFDTAVDSIYVMENKEQAYCLTTKGKVFFKQFIGSANLKVKNIFQGGQKLEVPSLVGTPFHFIVSIKGQKQRPFSYANILLKDSMLLRVSDIGDRNSRRGEITKEGRLILCVQVRPEYGKEKDRESLAKTIFGELVNLGLIQPNSEMLNYHFELFNYSLINPKTYKLFKQTLAPFVTLFDNDDITANILFHSKRWLKMKGAS